MYYDYYAVKTLQYVLYVVRILITIHQVGDRHSRKLVFRQQRGIDVSHPPLVRTITLPPA